MKKRFVFLVIVLLVIFGGTFGWDLLRSYFIKRYFATFQPPPVAISTTKATLETWHPHLVTVGSLMAVNGVNVSSEVSGQVLKIFFKSGEVVKKDDPLVQLDDAVDQQTLNNNLAQLTLNQLNYDRQVELYRKRATSKSELDAAKAKLQQLQASVASDRVMIAKKLIKAPFDGKLGIREVNVGQYVKPGDSLVPLQSMHPLFVDFTLPEQNVPDLYKNQEIQLTTEAFPGKIFKGNITAIGSKVQVGTRSIKVRAIIPNKDNKLFPGMFADINVILPRKQNVITVPQTAISYSLYGDSIYVVVQKGKDKKGKSILIAEQKYVVVGPRRGIVVAIKRGIKAGDEVVTSGQLKLHSGVHVVINNSVKLN